MRIRASGLGPALVHGRAWCIRGRAEEAWVVIWPEHLGTTAFEQGVDQAQLAADYQALTGQQLVIPQ